MFKIAKNGTRFKMPLIYHRVSIESKEEKKSFESKMSHASKICITFEVDRKKSFRSAIFYTLASIYKVAQNQLEKIFSCFFTE